MRYIPRNQFNSMKKAIFLVLIAISGQKVFSQLYYQDILSISQINQKHALNRANSVKKISFLSFDGEGKPIEGFNSTQEYSRDFKEVVTKTQTPLSGPTLSTSSFSALNQLVQSVDTSDGSKTVITYEYNGKGQLTVITNTTTSAGGFSLVETHSWEYNTKGQPAKMLKVKNGKDTTYVEFTYDEQGNVAEEKSMQKGVALPTVYYYYDEMNNLTDIVRYNNAARRLLPDYIFEYEGKNRLASMLVVTEGTSDYQKWYYSYDEDGLKILDACYSKTKVLIGRIEYQYEYFK